MCKCNLWAQWNDCRFQRRTCGLHHALQDHHDLQILMGQVLFGDLPEGAVLIDLVADDERRHQEEPVVSGVVAHVHVRLIERDELSLLGLFGLDQFGSNGCLHDVRVPQVPDAKHQTKPAVANGDDGVGGEHQSLCTLLGLRDLHEHAAHHEGIDDGAQHRLHQQQQDALGALVSDHPVAVADGRLRLYREQERRHKAVEVVDARSPLVVSNVLQISSYVSDQPPHEAEEQPRHGVNQHEDEQVEPPLEVHQCGEDVRQVAVGLLHVSVMHVALAVFADVALDLLLGALLVLQRFGDVVPCLLGALGLSDRDGALDILLHLDFWKVLEREREREDQWAAAHISPPNTEHHQSLDTVVDKMIRTLASSSSSETDRHWRLILVSLVTGSNTDNRQTGSA